MTRQEIDNIIENCSRVLGVTDTNVGDKEDGVRYSIVRLDDGKEYVEADRQIITSNDVATMRKDVTNFFRELLKNGNVKIVATNGDVLTISKETAKKARDNYLQRNNKRIKLSEDMFKVKINAEAHIDEITEISMPSGNPKTDKKEHVFGNDGFTYRNAYFKDLDGKFYKIKLSIGNSDGIATIYNVTPQKNNLPSGKIISRRGSMLTKSNAKPNGKLLFNNNVPQKDTSVNTYSTQNSKNNAQTSNSDTVQYAENGEKMNNVRKSVSDINTEYMAIAEKYKKGDKISEEDNQKLMDMVISIASKKMPHTKVLDGSGKVLPMYHQTSKEFTVFRPKGKEVASKYDNETPNGNYFKPSDNDIKLGGKIQMKVFLNSVNPIIVNNRRELVRFWEKNIKEYSELKFQYDNNDKHYSNLVDEIEEKYFDDERGLYWKATDISQNEAKKVEEEYVKKTDAIFEEWESKNNEISLQMKRLLNAFIENSNYDGIHIINDEGSMGRKVETWEVFSSNQVKSADLITYDDNGNVIPLSERFNDKNKDIRYSVSDIIKENDIKNIQSIGRKSLNDFTSEDISKTEAFAKIYYQQLKEKSPFFRAWFGDWRAYDKSFAEVANIPIYVNSNEERKANRVPTENKDTGWTINISRQGETNTISHSGADRLSEYGLAGINELIENAILLDTEVHEHHNNNAKNDLIAFDHKFYTLGKEINGDIGLYKITIEEYFQDKKHSNNKRFHNLKYITKIAGIPVDALANNNRSGGSTMDLPANYTVSQLFELVKRFDKNFKPKMINSDSAKYLLNEDGTPKVVYHGTNEAFDIFDRQYINKYDNGTSKIKDIGFFFTDDYELAKEHAEGASLENGKNDKGYVFNAYLDIKKPLVVEVDEWYARKKYYDSQLWYDKNKKDILEEFNNVDYDGIIVTNPIRKDNLYMIMNSNQVKSATDNLGTFDGNNENTLYSVSDLKDGGNDQINVMWTIGDNVLSKFEVKLFFEKISEINNYKKKNYEMSYYGDYVLDIGNKLVYTDGDYDYPTIYKVISFDIDNENLLLDAKEIIKIHEKAKGSEGIREACSIIELFIRKQGCVTVRNREDSETFRNSGKSGGDGKTNTRGTTEETREKIRYSASNLGDEYENSEEVSTQTGDEFLEEVMARGDEIVVSDAEDDEDGNVSKVWENSLHKKPYEPIQPEVEARKNDFIYEGITNKETYDKAENKVAKLGFDKSVREILQKASSDREWTAKLIG